MSIENIRAIKEAAKLPKPPKFNTLRKVSLKKQARIEAEKALTLPDEDNSKERWFKARRKELVGTCQCGCGKPSQKKDDMYFRHSCCHIFPKSKFESVMYHKLNCVERAFFGGCHSVMDDTSMDRWPNMADFEDIKEKFYVLAPLLTDSERATKFYRKLESLVYEKP